MTDTKARDTEKDEASEFKWIDPSREADAWHGFPLTDKLMKTAFHCTICDRPASQVYHTSGIKGGLAFLCCDGNEGEIVDRCMEIDSDGVCSVEDIFAPRRDGGAHAW